MRARIRNALTVLMLSGALLADAQGMQAVAQSGDFPAFPTTSAPTHHSHPRGVSLSKSAEAPPNLDVRGTFDYQLALSNNTSQQASAALSDTLPAETELVGLPAVMEIAPGATPLTVTVDSSIGPHGTIRWEGTLAAGAKIKITFKVKLISCPQQQQMPFIGWERSVKNAATLRTSLGNEVSVAAHAFTPGGCRGNPGPSPRPEPQPVPGADVTVRKFARLHPDFDWPERGWRASWLVAYGNRGDQAAQDVQVIDTPSSNQTLTFVRSAPRITPTQESGALIFDVGALSSRRGGSIRLKTAVPFSAAAGTVLTNSAHITAANDVTTTNNTAVVTLTLPHLPPIITYPVSGATCTGTLTVTGQAQAGSPVDVYADETLIGSVVADGEGNWSVGATLEDGFHLIQAQTKDANGRPQRSRPALIKVDSALTWDPISLTFTGPDGERRHPRHWRGWFESTDWYVALAPSTTYTVSVRVCCEDVASTSVTLTVPGTGVVTLADPDGDKTYAGTFTTGNVRSMVTERMKLCVMCEGEMDCAFGRILPLPRRSPDHIVVITPDGFDPPNLHVQRGDVIEFVNMDETARSMGTVPNMTSMQAGEAQAQSFDAVQLEVGESYSIEASSSTTYYDAQNSAQKAEIVVGGTYLPVIRR